MPGVKNDTFTRYGTAVFPEPSALPPEDGARVPPESTQVTGLAVKKRNQPVVAALLGLAAALSVALVATTAVAAPVVTVGAFKVVNCCTAPNEVPTTFCTMAQ